MDITPPDRTSEIAATSAWIRRLARGLVADTHLAEDIAQDAWVLELEHGGVVRSRAWLAGVLRHIALRKRRATGRRTRHEALAARGEASESTRELVARGALHRDLTAAVMRLDEPYRTTILLRYLEGLPPRAIARQLGVPVRTVGSRLARGLAFLRQDLDERGGGRDAWLPGVAALGGSGALGGGGAILGGILMGTMAKATAVAGLAAVLVLCLREFRNSDEGPAFGRAEDVALADAGDEGASRLTNPRATDVRGSATSAETGATVTTGRILLRGRVIDAACPDLGLAEEPADSASVSLWISAKDDLAWAGRATSVGEARVTGGAFGIEVPDPGYRPVFLKAQCGDGPKHRSGSAKGRVEVGAATSSELLIIRPPFGVLHGIVREARDAPLPDVHLKGTLRPAGHVETVTDEQGRFMLVPGGFLDELEVLAPGYAPLFMPRVLPRDEGGYEDIEIVLATTGRLIVHVVDGKGGAVAGCTVNARLAPEELPPGSVPDMGANVPVLTTKTDAGGSAELVGVWLGRKLSIGVALAAGERRYDRVQDGRLAAEPSAGEVLVVPAQGVLEVTALAPLELLLRIEAVLPDGSPPPKPAYEFVDTAGRVDKPWTRLARGEGDELGRISVRLLREDISGELGILVTDNAFDRALSWRDPTINHAAYLLLDPARAQDLPDASGGVLDVRMVLQPVHAIGGRVVDDRGSPVFYTRVWAVPAGSPSPHTPTALGTEASVETRKTGEFLIIGLPDGPYDLYAGIRFPGNGTYGFSTGLVRLNDVPAGTRGAEIVVPATGGVHVRLTLGDLGPGPAPERMSVLVGYFLPSDGRAPPADSPERIEGRSLGSWPIKAPWHFSGGASQSNAGRFWYRLYTVDQVGQHTVRDLGEGWYLFGVELQAGAPRTLTHFPVATGLVYLRPGEHEVHLTPTPVAPFRGRVASADSVAHLAVALLDDAGDAIPLEQPGEMWLEQHAYLPLNAAGEFFCPVAPLGRHALRVGTQAQLDAGSFQREFEVEVTAEQAEPLVLRL